MGPVVAVNGMDVEDGSEAQAGHKEGTVGRPIPGVAVRTVDPDTFEEVPDGMEGMLLVKGPGMMDGYIGDTARTAEAMIDGWYKSGDIALIDEDGFIRITGRLSRFSKIAGEMVPHGRIEEVTLAILGVRAAIVTAAPDPAKGERIVLLYEGDAMPEAVLKGLAASSLPKLWLPKRDGVRKLDAVPVLGSGKADLKKAKEIAAAV
jgi:acyl-[acyl-carrier-protein]-phospholipid O-acyltransferase/long-chain-fatty-acid--[acyl-carrier-protein] ligase